MENLYGIASIAFVVSVVRIRKRPPTNDTLWISAVLDPFHPAPFVEYRITATQKCLGFEGWSAHVSPTYCALHLVGITVYPV